MSKWEQEPPQVTRGMATIRHAVENASRTPLDDTGIRAILRGENGDPSHLRAVFGNVSLQVLEVAAATGVRLTGLLAYQTAQRSSRQPGTRRAAGRAVVKQPALRDGTAPATPDGAIAQACWNDPCSLEPTHAALPGVAAAKS